jgi:hypothetical protein
MEALLRRRQGSSSTRRPAALRPVFYALQDDPVARRAISSHAAPRQNNIKAYDVQRAKDATSLDFSLLFPSSSLAGAREHWNQFLKPEIKTKQHI